MRELSKWRIESKPPRCISALPLSFLLLYILFIPQFLGRASRQTASQPANQCGVETMGVKKERGRQAVGALLHPLERSAAATALYIFAMQLTLINRHQFFRAPPRLLTAQAGGVHIECKH
jgi:hypothetical protein